MKTEEKRREELHVKEGEKEREKEREKEVGKDVEVFKWT